MDKMCKQSGVERSIKSLEDSREERNTRCGSPVFKCVTQVKSVRESFLNSSDCDITSHQVNQSIKNRTSSKYGNETSDSVLPFCPIFSPIPVVSAPLFQPPIHSLGNISRTFEKSTHGRVNIFSVSNKKEILKPGGIFEGLGMFDKDISWVSSMASPPPKQVPGSEFNTVEKATFLPENNFQSIQPRALFSPTFDDDFGCHPITFTSESDDEEGYKSNIRLSDVCATLKQLEVKSLDQGSSNSAEKIILEEDSLISPVIRAKKKRPGVIKKKKKGTLVVSPKDTDRYEFSVGENSKVIESDKVNSNDKNHIIEDDSFQSMSFSYLDELCKTLVTEQSNSFVTSKANDSDKTLVNCTDMNSKPVKHLKKFYSTRAKNDVFAVSSMDNLYSYAKALEEGDKHIPTGGKIDQSYAEKGIVRFDILSKDLSKSDATKRLHSEVTEEKDESIEKKFKKVDDKSSDWENVKQYLSESQLNISDDEIFRTLENLEKTLVSQEKKDADRQNGNDVKEDEPLLPQNFITLKTSAEISEECQIQEDNLGSKQSTDLLEFGKIETYDTKASSKGLHTIQFPTFTTASGSKISVSEKALNRAREILKDCDEILEDFNSKESTESLNRSDGKPQVVLSTEGGFMEKFSILSGNQTEISDEVSAKASTALECEPSESSFKQMPDDPKGVLKNKFWDGLMRSFSTGSGTQIQITAETLAKAKSFTSESEENPKEQFGHVPEGVMASFSTSSGKKIQACEEFLAKGKADISECDDQKEEPWIKGFKTGTGKLIRVSAESLEKAKALMSDCDEENTNKFTINYTEVLQATSHSKNPVSSKVSDKPKEDDGGESSEVNPTVLKGFSTCSGKNISISAKALENAKLFFKKCDDEFNKNFDELGSASSHKISEVCRNEAKVEACEKSQMKEDTEIPMIGFFSAVGNKVKVSSKALEKAKKFWSKSDETTENLAKPLPPFERSSLDFSPEEKSKATTSEASLIKAKEGISDGNQSKSKVDCPNSQLETSEKKLEISIGEKRLNEPNSGIDELGDDWDEIVPSWLHVYKTSPSMVPDRLQFSSVTCQEEKDTCKPARECIVKSPVLGSSDRFYGKAKRRKLRFGEEKRLENKTESEEDADRKTSAKRISNLCLDFSAPFKRIKIVDDFKTVSADVKQERARAREEQEKIIREKQKVKPLVGSHLKKKRSERQMSWSEAVARSSPETHSDEFLRSLGVNEDVLLVNVKNSMNFRFSGEYYFGLATCLKNTKGILAGDECLLILDDENKLGVKEIKRAFLASSGVQPNLLPHGWVENHYKWIVWKLAHYERSFPLCFGGRCLTPNQVMLQLKYRYDREIDRSERSALKKILERDDSSIKRLVLCVCGIKEVMVNETVNYELELTDGWYSCPARSDPAMSRLIKEGKLSIGTKLLIQGATLFNCEQGVSPLEERLIRVVHPITITVIYYKSLLS